MTDALPTLAAALLAGLLGSPHCLGMCAGISGVFALHDGAHRLARQVPMAVAYNAGRLASYALLGLLVAALGNRAVSLMPVLAGPVRLLAGIIIVLLGLQIAFDWRALQPIERMGGLVWARIAPLAKGLLPVTNLPRALGLGLLWGLLPCGLVYSMLLIAATSASPADGALIMLAFGTGTTPAMLMTGLGAARLSQAMRRRHTRLGAGALIVVIGVLTLAMPLAGSIGGVDHSAHGHAGHSP